MGQGATITVYDSAASARPLPFEPLARSLGVEALWVDIVGASEDEKPSVECAADIELPRAQQIAEIGTSSRLSVEGDCLTMPMPVLFHETGELHPAPVAFVLATDRLVTMRCYSLKSFTDDVAGRQRGPPLSGQVEVMLGLLDGIIALTADGMEAVGADLDAVSEEIFGHARTDDGMTPVRIERRSTATLETVGRSGETTSCARDSLLGLNRLLVFLADRGGDHVTAEHRERVEVFRRDVAALGDYETRLSDDGWILLGSTLGHINVEQNRKF